MATQIKITQLTDIGSANLAVTTLLPVVNMAGVPTTQKTTLGNLANVILSQAGGNYAPVATANIAYSVANAAQPNITSTGTLTGLTVSGTTNLGAVGNVTITGGTNGQVLTTNGSNVLSWTTVSSGSSNTAVTVTANAQPNITSVGNLSYLVVNGNVDATNIDVANTVYANYFVGDGSSITDIDATNVIGNVANANYSTYAGTVITGSQPNITSVGNLAGLTITGVTTLGTVTNLGDVGNVKIDGGIDGDVLGTDGANLFWVAQTDIGNFSFSNNIISLNVPANLVINSDGQNFIVNANSRLFTYKPDGTFVLPGGSEMFEASGNLNMISGGLILSMGPNANAHSHWQFSGDGNLTLPGNTFAVNYANGQQVPISGGNPFDQDLNTTDNVQFANVTSTDAIRFSNSGNIVGALGYAPTYVSIESYQSNSVNITANDIYTWSFDNLGNLTIPGTITGGNTITIDNRNSGNAADINLYSADDILIQARDRDAGSTSEGGDINIFAGDSAEDSDTSAGDIVIEAGAGGASNLDFGGSGGFVRVEAGQGGAAVGANISARSGGSLTLSAGDAGGNNGNIDLGNSGGDVTINAGDSTGNGNSGGDIILRSGDAGANALAGQIQLIIPGSDSGDGGAWTFNGAGIIQLPNSGTIGNDGNNIDIGSTSAISLEASTVVNIYTDTNTAAYQWQYGDNGQLTLPTIELDVGNTINEKTVIQSQRKIIPGLRYSAVIDGATPTVVYTATSIDTTSMKVTMQIQHTGLGMEFFDVSATTTGGNTFYTVSNRVQPPTISNSTVVVDLNGSNIMEITVTINSGAANSWVTYDATEFGIAVD